MRGSGSESAAALSESAPGSTPSTDQPTAERSRSRQHRRIASQRQHRAHRRCRNDSNGAGAAVRQPAATTATVRSCCSRRRVRVGRRVFVRVVEACQAAESFPRESTKTIRNGRAAVGGGVRGGGGGGEVGGGRGSGWRRALG